MPREAKGAKCGSARAAKQASAAVPSRPRAASSHRPRPARRGLPRSWHISLALEGPGLLELTRLGKRRRAIQQRRAVGLVREVADTTEILRQKRRLFRHRPSELVERGVHVTRPAHVLPIDV